MGAYYIKLFFSNLVHEGLVESLRRLCFRFFRVNTFFIYELDLGMQASMPPIPQGVIIKEVSHSELKAMRRGANGLPSEFFRDNLAGHERSFACMIQGDLAAIAWVSNYKVDGLITLLPKEAGITYLYCLPRYRGMGLGQRLLLQVSGHLRAEGSRAVKAAVHDGNFISAKVFEKAGFVRARKKMRWGFITWGPGRGSSGHV